MNRWYNVGDKQQLDYNKPIVATDGSDTGYKRMNLKTILIAAGMMFASSLVNAHSSQFGIILGGSNHDAYGVVEYAWSSYNAGPRYYDSPIVERVYPSGAGYYWDRHDFLRDKQYRRAYSNDRRHGL